MNEIVNAIKNRRSIRKFRNVPLEDEKLAVILEAGRWAPSLGNSQPWSFIVVRDQEIKKKLAIATNHDSIVDSSVAIAISVDPGIDGIHPLEDGSAACQNMALAAYSLGLGSYWIGVCNTAAEAKVREILKVPDAHRVTSILPVGYAAESVTKRRKELGELVYYEEYGRSDR